MKWFEKILNQLNRIFARFLFELLKLTNFLMHSQVKINHYRMFTQANSINFYLVFIFSFWCHIL